MFETASACIRCNKEDVAKVVLMPGDPLRAKFIAEHYLENPVLFNDVRNMLGYTGTYKGKRISVMGHGMGIPSIGIYTQELYSQFGVEAIIRIGSAGGLDMDVDAKDHCPECGNQLQHRQPLRLPRQAGTHCQLGHAD